MLDYCFKAEERYTTKSYNDNFFLHSHDEYEIYMFMEGDCNYIVEEKSYPLAQGDMVIIRKNEMHRAYHNSKTSYRRFILMISPAFFEKYGCPEYESAFLDKSFDESNKINAETVKSSGLYDAIMRLKRYTDDYKNQESPVAYGIVTEILYLLNKISVFESAAAKGTLTKNVMSYINSNLKNDITLDILAKEFFVSKYYLCHMFKKNTGLTVKEYINQKRLEKVNELIKEGKSFTESAALSGFRDYSSFYRTYVKSNKVSPRSKKQN